MPHITIIGLGLIGGSFGLALRGAKVGYNVVGHDRDPEVAGRARKRGAVDRVEWNLPAAVAGAGLVIVAVPLDALRSVFEQIAPHLAQGCTVTDTASTKRQVLAWAAEALPAGLSFVGGHPMAGKETGGIDNAAADLFAGRAYCLTPAPDARAEAIDLVVGLATTVEARPYFLDPAEHDSFAAAVSHLPFLAATALVNTAAGDPTWKDTALLAAGGFGDATRLAAGDAATHRAICQTNQDAVLRWLDAYGERLAAMRAAIAADDGGEALENLFRLAREARERWQRAPHQEEPAVAVPRPSDYFRQLLGGRIGERRRT